MSNMKDAELFRRVVFYATTDDIAALDAMAAKGKRGERTRSHVLRAICQSALQSENIKQLQRVAPEKAA